MQLNSWHLRSMQCNAGRRNSTKNKKLLEDSMEYTVQRQRWQPCLLMIEVPCAEENSCITVGIWINSMTSCAAVFTMQPFTEEPTGFVTKPVTAFGETSKITPVVAAVLQRRLEMRYNHSQFLLQVTIWFIICKFLHLHKYSQINQTS